MRESNESPREVPRTPGHLELAIERRWDGSLPRRSELRAQARLSATADGLGVEVGMPHQRPVRLPDAPSGARVDGLWEFDVVECFFVAADGRYLELELGAGGHYLALAFSAPRQRSGDFADTRLEIDWRRDADAWCARCVLPRSWLPQPIVRANAFAIGGGEFLAHQPTGGERPDFHRPERFPAIRIPSWE
jgi:hypothetical protein